MSDAQPARSSIERAVKRVPASRSGTFSPVIAIPGRTPQAASPAESVPNQAVSWVGCLEVALPRDATLLLYTDGVADAADPAGGRFGLKRLIEAADRAAAGSPREIIEQVVAAVTAFRGERALSDDLTMVTLTFAPARVRGSSMGAAVVATG